VGFNRRSLGISFNGNFETNPNVPFSNPDSRYGPPRPMEPQLRAGRPALIRKAPEDPNLWADVQPAGGDTRADIILGIRELEECGYLRDFGSWRLRGHRCKKPKGRAQSKRHREERFVRG